MLYLFLREMLTVVQLSDASVDLSSNKGSSGTNIILSAGFETFSEETLFFLFFLLFFPLFTLTFFSHSSSLLSVFVDLHCSPSFETVSNESKLETLPLLNDSFGWRAVEGGL